MAEYLQNANATVEVKGLNLSIDPHIQRLCETSNSSSSHTRGTLYILVLISVISLVGVLNTSRLTSWTNERITAAEEDYRDLLKLNRDSVKILSTKKHLEKEVENKSEKIELVQIPIIGNVFDVNNLCFVSGISFIIILYILRYTSRREKKNLRIALHAVSQRYPDPNDYINKTALMFDVNPKTLTEKEGTIHSIVENEEVVVYNFIRRKYHYNFLSMNEVFSLPKDTLDEKEKGEEKDESLNSKKSIDERFILSYFLYFPSIVYFLIFLNDATTIYIGYSVAGFHTIGQTVISYFMLIVICDLCRRCNNEKLVAQAYYDHAFINKFKFSIENVNASIHERKDIKDIKMRFAYILFYPGIMLFELICRKPIKTPATNNLNNL